MKTKFMEKGDVTLRPLEVSDAEFMRDILIHPDVRNTIGRPPKPVNIEAQRNWIKEVTRNSDEAHFLIEHNGKKAGNISINGLESEYRKGEFGVSVHPDHQGKGIGTIAVKLIVDYGFETLNRHKIRGGYLEGNEASKRVMEKAGFQEEGIERDYKYVDGEWKNVHWMSILEEEYYD
jgi:RimJ/RimL family protein N-acetyltransferase